ncbi:hypothetical protein HJFPF1_04570 [Paramyrothecium foliicola]|nr:hypothetical protein HJFPF1_04570 [Paramyrothecium foliicola]
MRTSSLLQTLAALATAVQGTVEPRLPTEDVDHQTCLSREEAWSITRRWLDIYSTNGGISTKAELATIVSPDIKSYDYTFGPPVFGIDQLWDVLTAPANATTTNITQAPNFLLHTCKEIAYNWQYTAVTTGYNSTVPAGTPVSLTGNDILLIDLKTRLISNATSCGDYILLAQQLGDSCNV